MLLSPITRAYSFVHNVCMAPDAITKKLHADIVAAVNKPDVQKRLVALGTEVVTSESPQAFKQFVVDNHKMWGDVVKKVGVTQ